MHSNSVCQYTGSLPLGVGGLLVYAQKSVKILILGALVWIFSCFFEENLYRFKAINGVLRTTMVRAPSLHFEQLPLIRPSEQQETEVVAVEVFGSTKSVNGLSGFSAP
eukprot:gb/GECG01006943.1/.p1 GENE.gb/GECG01006943.1/~~gb/GECG01006943.1/.p1  ORF type:complete len:108 (+),score=7.42 gb/GECG01006943.1/:1-324(+)